MKKLIRIILIVAITILGLLVITTPFVFHQYGAPMERNLDKQLKRAIKEDDNFMFLDGDHGRQTIIEDYKHGEHIEKISDMQGGNSEGLYVYFAQLGKQKIELNVYTKDSGVNYFFPKFKLDSVRVFDEDGSSGH
ncbi:hypothetical protein EQG49_11710 [Periweissella cryptocerci]|uniref:Uncharacterized protein n=1 Tax=Periweissella cryptocerci TaxID=2506420 RepID=A0A4P6YW54_9LACO|nr:hypothetical protein [Periweissella cryptocerci]QBO37072.1 hypothetical protein EQG49_11710 [Periweissella cryptocerci]